MMNTFNIFISAVKKQHAGLFFIFSEGCCALAEIHVWVGFMGQRAPIWNHLGVVHHSIVLQAG